jgi:hypothetical protein
MILIITCAISRKGTSMSGTLFCINEKQVAYETFDGEILAVNVESGIYYSLGGAAARIWEALLGGATVEAIAESLAAVYSTDRSEISSSVAPFVAQLLDENLIRAGEPINRGGPAARAYIGQEKLPFAPPTMEIFSDMQDLLLLDPIHEVDDAGWPVLKAGGNK